MQKDITPVILKLFPMAFLFSTAHPAGLPFAVWPSREEPRGTVQIVHGLAEHGGRYARLAAALNAAGYTVYAGDLPGHGVTCTQDQLGFFADSDGWRKCLERVQSLHRQISLEHPSLPHFLLGHSMGSFLVQEFICQPEMDLAGVILSGSDGPPPPLARIGRLIARIERIRLGPHGRSSLLRSFSFGRYNRFFRPARTAYDWLSRDSREVDLYLADSCCGFNPTVQLWIDLLDALNRLHQPSNLVRIPKGLHIDLIAGSRDPVSSATRGLEKLWRCYENVGLKNVSRHFYKEARHELFNEINREEITRDLLVWLDQIMATRAHGSAPSNSSYAKAREGVN